MAALEFGDQPDYYDTDQLPRFWDLSSDMEVASGEGYGGADAWEAGSAGAYAVKFPAGVHPTRWGFVVRVKIDALPASAVIILAVVDVGDPPAVHLSAVLNTDGTVSIYRGTEVGTVLGSSSEVLPSDGSTFRLGFDGLISPATGNAAIWFAAGTDALVEICQCGGVNTDGVGSGVRRGVYIGGAPDVFLSYLYTQGAGTMPDAPLCDVLMPDADSALMDWAPEGAANMADATDESPANDDDDYGYALEVNDRYALEHATAPARSQYLGTRQVATVQNAEDTALPGSPLITVPTYTFTPLIRASSGSVVLGSPRSVTSTDWKGVDHVAAVNPFTGLPWSTATINDAAFGGKTTV